MPETTHFVMGKKRKEVKHPIPSHRASRRRKKWSKMPEASTGEREIPFFVFFCYSVVCAGWLTFGVPGAESALTFPFLSISGGLYFLHSPTPEKLSRLSRHVLGEIKVRAAQTASLSFIKVGKSHCTVKQQLFNRDVDANTRKKLISIYFLSVDGAGVRRHFHSICVSIHWQSWKGQNSMTPQQS